jgi:hypothetical protein
LLPINPELFKNATLILTRGIPVHPDRFLYAAEFLRHLSLQQAWVEEPMRTAE